MLAGFATKMEKVILLSSLALLLTFHLCRAEEKLLSEHEIRTREYVRSTEDRCDACHAVAYQLSNRFAKLDKEKVQETCIRDNFLAYEIRLVGGEEHVSGPAIEKRGSRLDYEDRFKNKKWPDMLAWICNDLINENGIGKVWDMYNGRELKEFQSNLCPKYCTKHDEL